MCINNVCKVNINCYIHAYLLKDFPYSLAEVGGHYDPTNISAVENYNTTVCNPGNPQACETSISSIQDEGVNI